MLMSSAVESLLRIQSLIEGIINASQIPSTPEDILKMVPGLIVELISLRNLIFRSRALLEVWDRCCFQSFDFSMSEWEFVEELRLEFFHVLD